MKVLRRSDRIKITIRDTKAQIAEGERFPVLLEFRLAPLTMAQKTEIKNCRQLQGGAMKVDGLKAVALATKYSLKEVTGLELSDGSPFPLAFEDASKNALTDECVDDLMNIELSNILSLACVNLTNNVYTELTLGNGEVIPGVEVDLTGGEQKK